LCISECIKQYAYGDTFFWTSSCLVRIFHPMVMLLFTFKNRNIRKQQATFAPVSILPILDPNTEITSAVVNHNGAPVVHLSSGFAYSYDPNLLSWIKLGDKWWANGSSAWQGRQRTGNSVSNRGIVSTIESTIGEQNEGNGGADIQRPAWWEAALTLGHLETRLQASVVLDSPIEYKQALLVYAKKIADEGFRAKAEELVKELFGPLYW
jgi:protein HIRA/HIR1